MAAESGEPSSRPPLVVLVDLNVILDVLQKREPHYPMAASLWAAIEQRKLQGLVAAHSLTTLFYLLRKHLGGEPAQSVLRDLLKVFAVAAVDEGVIREALQLGWHDFEDAVQMAAAAQARASAVVTRNPGDFKGGPIRVLVPSEVPALLAEVGAATARPAQSTGKSSTLA